MKKDKLKLGLSLFVLGLTGVFSLLTMAFPSANVPQEIRDQFSEEQLRWLVLVNPAINLIIAVVVGTLLYDKVKLGAPILNGWIKRERVQGGLAEPLKYGLVAGLLIGILLLLIEQLFFPFLPQEFIALGESLKVSPLVRIFYGGITEEILLRFGLMTFLVWLIYKIAGRLNSWVYWAGIVLSSLAFAAGHLPTIFFSIDEPGTNLILYIMIANSLGGIGFGWLYWKKGLEAAFVAHIFTHVTIMAAAWLIQ